MLTPVDRLSMVFGKFLAVSTAALVSVIISLGSMYAAMITIGSEILSGNFGGNTQALESLGFSLSVDPKTILVVLLVSVLLVLMFSAVLLSVSIFARSFKEAQSYIGPSYLVIILPVTIINSLPGFEPENWFFAIPVVNSVSLFKELLVGVFNVQHIIYTIVSLLFCAIISILFATRIYSKETVLFKE